MSCRLLPPLALCLGLVAWPSGDRATAIQDAGAGVEAHVLAPTTHAPIPTNPEQSWLVPGGGVPVGPDPSGVGAALRTAVDSYARGEAGEALAQLSPAIFSGTPLADYASYYAGTVQVRLAQLDEARRTFAGLQAARPQGYLSVAAILREAEVADAQGDHAAAVRLYETLVSHKAVRPGQVLHRLGLAALAAGDRARAADALARVYYEYPLSEAAGAIRTELRRLAGALPSGRARDALELGRAQRLFEARRYKEARDAFQALRPRTRGDERALVDLRLAACDYSLRRYTRARRTLQPYLARVPHRAEVHFFYLSAVRGLGRDQEYLERTRRFTEEFPDSPWTEEALDGLASHHVRADDDAAAARVFVELYERFPKGSHAQRAAWKAGWWAYRMGDDEAAIRFFESAAAAFPRSDYRPAYLYWAGRAQQRLGRREVARARFELVFVDYANSYYGRLAATQLNNYGGLRAQGVGLRTEDRGGRPEGLGQRADRPPAAQPPAPPPTAELIRLLLAAGLDDDALNELTYARDTWGTSPLIEATLAWVYHRKGELRRAINAMKRAYPQHLVAGGENLPDDVLRIIFPLDYWDLVRRHATARNLDPYLIAALVAQESTFDPAIRSAANAYGLMQIVPSTGRRVARALGLRRFRTAMLKDPETNVRLGTAHFAELLETFGDVHLALAGYNAGEHRVTRWLAEREGLKMAPEEFIDDIPFPETQNYVKKVLGTVDDYRRLYGGA